MNIKSIEAVPVVRDESGSWWHPDMPDFDEGQNDEWNAWIAEQGLEISRGMLTDMPIDHPVYVDYFENGSSSFADWVDEPPAGEGWFTLEIQDTEDGPVWCWARRIVSIVAPAPTEQAMTPIEGGPPLPTWYCRAIYEGWKARAGLERTYDEFVSKYGGRFLGWESIGSLYSAKASSNGTVTKDVIDAALAARQAPTAAPDFGSTGFGLTDRQVLLETADLLMERNWCGDLAETLRDMAGKAPDTRNVWTDEQRENHRKNKALVYRCTICCARSGEPHLPSCPEGQGISGA